MHYIIDYILYIIDSYGTDIESCLLISIILSSYILLLTNTLIIIKQYCVDLKCPQLFNGYTFPGG